MSGQPKAEEQPSKQRRGKKKMDQAQKAQQQQQAVAHAPIEANALLTAVAGALAGAVARFVVGPLDVLKIRFQVQLEPIAAGVKTSHYTSMRQALVTIVKEEGIKGLWRGTVPGQLLTVPYTAVQFVALQQCRALARQYGLADSPRWQSAVPFVSGALAGAAATVASYPFDLLRTTLAAQGEPPVYATMTDAARGIVRQHGVRGLYRGLGVTVLEIMPYAALQFGLYDVFNKACNKARVRLDPAQADEAPSSMQAFVCGLAAGMLAKLGTHPLDVAKKRFQVAGLARSARYGQRVAPEAVHTLRQVLHDIAVKEGAAGLFKGAMPSILKAAPSAAVTFAVYDMCMYWLTLRDRQAAAAAAATGDQAPAAAAAKPAARSPLH
ncbi:hypothetical protein COHA_010286 [Chlorella ohadii]|uniref:Mitochondrial thiamine pyrophosphate carrier n=1 Tax=Chlorella ohadii TaxID=2649997 RepID=A0AAD5GXC4_9CHLO|nr:hypothetical protein COHA_010286 [Chlorella ohadii]